MVQPLQPCTRGRSQPSRGRRVALKRFKKTGSRSFQTERAALMRVGVHPHVLRYLESFEASEGGGEDVLVLEYCDGGSVFDLWASESHMKGRALPELLVCRLVNQLLSALQHVAACNVEHQDVKPENMLVYSLCLEEQRAELKLGDFGWAKAMAEPGQGGHLNVELPADGAGSLWYAPPELNPPVPLSGGLTGPSPGQMWVVGRSDMWSVGVVVYLLLVGQNPFSAAMRLKRDGSKAVEQRVLQLVAAADFDRQQPRWLGLAEEVRDFVTCLLQVSPAMRLPASEAMKHPFLTRRLHSIVRPESALRTATREDTWNSLDGLQRLGWAAVARAVAEPELCCELVDAAGVVCKASVSQLGLTGSIPSIRREAYVWQLARELAAAPVRARLRDTGAWSEVLRLAFCYLDVDCDGMVTPSDLLHHLEAQSASAAAQLWVARWGRPHGITLSCFRSALVASTFRDCVRSSETEGLPSDEPGALSAVSSRRSGAAESRCETRPATDDLCVFGDWQGGLT